MGVAIVLSFCQIKDSSFYIRSLLFRRTHAIPITTAQYPTSTTIATGSLAYILSIDTFTNPVNRFAYPPSSVPSQSKTDRRDSRRERRLIHSY